MRASHPEEISFNLTSDDEHTFSKGYVDEKEKSDWLKMSDLEDSLFLKDLEDENRKMEEVLKNLQNSTKKPSVPKSPASGRSHRWC